MSATATDLCGLCLDVDPDCDHDGPRVLPEIRYERIDGATPLETRFHVPESERRRIEHPPSTWKPRPPKSATADVQPVQGLVARLEDFIDLDTELEGLLRDTYAHDPLQTSRLVSYTVGKCESHDLRSPGGFLATRLHEIRRKR